MILIIIHAYKFDFTIETILFLSTTPNCLQICLSFYIESWQIHRDLIFCRKRLIFIDINFNNTYIITKFFFNIL
jgi:hypothetical protein